jgi:hypothetical protein
MSKEETLAGVITSIPELLMKANALKQQTDLQNRQFAIQAAQQGRLNEQSALQAQQTQLSLTQSALELEEFKKQRGMDAAGYGKPEASKFFENLAYSPSNLQIQGGELVYQGEKAFPTRADAKAKYKKIVTADGQAWTDTDSKIFDMGWQESVGIRNRMFIAELQTLNEQGYDEDDIQSVIANNPILEESIYNIKGYTNKDDSMFYSKFLPKKSVDFFDRVSDSPVATVGVGVGTAAAAEGTYRFLQSTPQGVLDEARLKYKSNISGLGDEVRTAQDLLDEVQGKKAYKGKAKDVKSAKALLEEAKSNLNNAKTTGSKELRKMVKENTRWEQLKGSKAGKLKHVSSLRGFAPTIFGLGGETVGGFVGGDKGAAVGKGAGATAGLVAGGMPLGQYVAKRLAMKAPAMAARFGIAAMADSPAIPVGDIIGAVMAGGMGVSEVMSAIEDWKKANR